MADTTGSVDPPSQVTNGGEPVTPSITHVILDLDGTLLDTESLATTVVRSVLEEYGAQLTEEGEEQRLGRSPMDAARDTVERYKLPCTPQELIARVRPMLAERWSEVLPLPGAARLLSHLHSSHIPLALASSSPRASVHAKLSYHSGWEAMFHVIVSGDEVAQAKPAPDIFLRTAQLLNADPARCLVIEDSPAGTSAARRAGMHVVVIPSISPARLKAGARSLYSDAHALLPSLLDLELSDYGLPPFTDKLHGVLPITVQRVKGPVIKGFGRGSKMLGIPTANLPADAVAKQMAGSVCGIYMGWAGLPTRGVFKMVMSVGWNPYFDNKVKSVEPWLLHNFDEDFYGEELRLVIVGYLRPEANFPSLDALVAQINADGDLARDTLDKEPYATYKSDPFLTSNNIPNA